MIRAIVAALLAVSAYVHPAPPMPHRNTYRAVIVCATMTEDSAAHLQLVAYAHDGATLRYRCVPFN